MSWAGIAACLWVVAAAIVALLPMRRQYAPGFFLLGLAPVLIVWLSLTYGWWIGIVALFAFVSMFRKPLFFIGKRLMGRAPARSWDERPK